MMLVLWLGCFVEIFVLAVGEKMVQTTLLPYPTLAAIISHIKELLVLMDKKIDVQRVKIGSSLGRRDLRVGNMSEPLDLHNESILNVQRHMDGGIAHPAEINTLSTQSFENNTIPVNISNKQSEIETLLSTQRYIDTMIRTNAPEPSQSETTQRITTVANIIKLKMENQMKQGTGYCVAALTGIINTIVARDMAFSTIEGSFLDIISRMTSDGKPAIFGNVLLRRIKLMTIWTVLSNEASKTDFLRNLQITFQDIDVMDSDIKKILTEYDTFFTIEEGNHLLNQVAEFYNTPREDTTAVDTAVQNMMDAFLAPAKRLQDTFEFRDLIHKINTAYQKRYPDFRSSDIDSVLNTIRENRNLLVESIPPRRMNLHNADYKYDQLLKHLKRKHSRILKQLLSHLRKGKNVQQNNKPKCVNCYKHHITHDTKKHIRQNNRKNRHESHPKRHHGQNKQRSRKENKRRQNISFPTSQSRSKTSRKKKRNIKTGRNRKHIVYANARRVITYNDTGSNTTIVNTKNFTLQPLSTRTPRHKNKLLKNNRLNQRVAEDSNYSDAETLLKNMLNKAFRNPNITLSTNSTDKLNKTQINQ